MGNKYCSDYKIKTKDKAISYEQNKQINEKIERKEIKRGKKFIS